MGVLSFAFCGLRHTNAQFAPQRLRITFTNPAYLDANVALRECEDHFDVMDTFGKLLTLGQCA